MPEPKKNTKSAPEKSDEIEDTAAPALAEIAGDELFTFTFDEQEYSFKRKRLEAMQYLGPMQAGKDTVATEFLLGSGQYQMWLARTADDDGCTTQDDYLRLWKTIGEGLGTGNR